jgi:F-type H+-transporting ATPase subunit delta
MAEKTTIARPYAQAIFDSAEAHGALARWSDMLGLLALIVEDPRIQPLIGNPRVAREQLAEVVLDVAGEALDDTARSLVRVMADNRRLDLLPEVREHYEQFRAEAEKVVEAEVVSAFPLTGQQQAQIKAALRHRLGREVNLICRTDASLVGGAVIRAGDLVIDGSVVEYIERLSSALAH